MPTSKVTQSMLAEMLASRKTLSVLTARELLAELDALMDRALQAGHEVEVGSLGYLSLREPVQTKPPKGEVTRGKRVAFREKNANRHRWK